MASGLARFNTEMFLEKRFHVHPRSLRLFRIPRAHATPGGRLEGGSQQPQPDCPTSPCHAVVFCLGPRAAWALFAPATDAYGIPDSKYIVGSASMRASRFQEECLQDPQMGWFSRVLQSAILLGHIRRHGAGTLSSTFSSRCIAAISRGPPHPSTPTLARQPNSPQPAVASCAPCTSPSTTVLRPVISMPRLQSLFKSSASTSSSQVG